MFVTSSFRVEQDVWDQFLAIARQQNISGSELIRNFIKDVVANNPIIIADKIDEIESKLYDRLTGKMEENIDSLAFKFEILKKSFIDYEYRVQSIEARLEENTDLAV